LGHVQLLGSAREAQLVGYGMKNLKASVGHR